jgi:tRNA threonylcarbamoyladenosine biosynthesis protein TsaE
MGTGKTTFIGALAKVMGALDEASSPTFALCQEYPVSTGPQLLRHLDLYRINHESELQGLGWEELMEDPGALTLVEWPERAADHFPERATVLRLERQPDGLRLASLWERESA